MTLLFLLALLSACATGNDMTPTSASSGSGSATGGAGTGGAGGGDAGPKVVCGDGIVSKGEDCGDGVTAGNEGCDDGNTVSGDGCSSTCKAEAGCEIEPNDGTTTANDFKALAIGGLVKGWIRPQTDPSTSTGSPCPTCPARRA